LIRYLDLPQVMAPMALLPSGPLAALFAQALGRRPKAIGGRRQTAIMTVFGQLPFQRFDALLLRADQPLEPLKALLLRHKSFKSFFESFAQVLSRFAHLLQLFVFALQFFAQALILS